MNGMEARLLFNEVIMETGNALAVERRATVVMPLQHFVAMAHVLQNQAPKAVEALKSIELALVAEKDAKKA